VNSYLSSHHTTTRKLTYDVFHPATLSLMRKDRPFTEELREKAVVSFERETER